MLERLYEDATSFGFPEERFERVYGEVELTLYRDAVRARVIAPLHGRVDGRRAGRARRRAVARARRPRRRAARGRLPEGPWPARPVRARARRAGRRPDPGGGGRRALRGARDGAAPVGARRRRARRARLAPGRPRALGSRWRSAPAAQRARRATGCCRRARSRRSASSSRRSASAPPTAAVAWALDRFEMGCAPADRRRGAVRLPARAARAARRDDARRARRASACALAALCAEEGERREVQRAPRGRARAGALRDGRLRAACALDAESPRELVAEVEGHLRALLRDVLCGYLDADLKAVADDILLESRRRAVRRDRGARPARGAAPRAPSREP